ncbi:hypothetical protein [Kitasatospora sp. NPDC093558]|uniref:hypothetical protein n=1 Tax=Kitasatospora sp. NPDC093558 TaxID=3155201 RepID=UPI003432B2E1
MSSRTSRTTAVALAVVLGLGAAPAAVADTAPAAGPTVYGLDSKGYSDVTGINNSGVVVGYAYPQSWEVQSTAMRWDTANITTTAGTSIPGTALAPLPGDRFDEAMGVNEAGTVIGISWPSPTDCGCSAQQKHAVRWAADGKPTALAPLPGDAYGRPVAVNAGGTAVGYTLSDAGQEHAVAWQPDGTPVALKPLPGDVRSVPSAVNSSGMAVGYSQGAAFDSPKHAIVWGPDGTATALDPAGDYVVSTASRINDAGTVLGQASPDGEASRGVVWDADGNPRELGVGRWGTALNAAGVVVGGEPDPVHSGGHAVRFDPDGTSTPLGGPLADYESSVAVAVNSAGAAVGYSFYGGPSRGNQAALSWTPGGAVTNLRPGDFAAASLVNDAGLVAGVLISHNEIHFALHSAAVWKP